MKSPFLKQTVGSISVPPELGLSVEAIPFIEYISQNGLFIRTIQLSMESYSQFLKVAKSLPNQPPMDLVIDFKSNGIGLLRASLSFTPSFSHGQIIPNTRFPIPSSTKQKSPKKRL